MKPTYKLVIIALLLSVVSIYAGAAEDNERIFRPITASDGIADNSAQTIKCTFTGRMTITTIGNINFYDGANFSHINSDQEVIYKLEDYHGHYHLYYDNNHHLWLKSSSGVSCVFLTTETYVNNMDSLFKAYGAKGKVTDMFVDKNGNVWLNDGSQMYCKNYAIKAPLKKNLNLQDLEVFNKSQLMLFYDNGLLECFDLKTGRKLYQNSAYNEDDAKTYYRSGVQLMHNREFFMIRNGEVGAILVHYDVDKREWIEVMRSDYHLNNMVVHDGKLYIASEWGYFTYNLKTGEINHYKELTLKSGRKLSTDINAIEFDLQGGMWLGTEKRGLLYGAPLNANFFQSLSWDNPLALKYEEMMRDLKGIYEFKGKKANVMLIDSRKWTWVGTLNGLYLYTSPQEEPIVFSRKNGLLNSVIHAVIEDDSNNIWASTSYGILCVRIKNGRIKQVFCFSDNDNVPNETFIDAKALKLPSGEIVMQALDHVVTFNPANFKEVFDQKAYEMHLKLTKLLVNGTEVHAGDKVDGDVVLQKAITRTTEIDLNYNQNSISLTFSALNFARPLQTYYRVRIKELWKGWREFSYFNSRGLVDRRGLLHLPLTGLKPGTYHVEILASVVPDKFVGEPSVWTVNVNQPWWRTTGTLMFLGLVVIAMAIWNMIVYNRNTRLKMLRNNEEGDLIRRIRAFVDRCDSYNSEKLSPTQEEIYGVDKDTVELSGKFVDVMLKLIPYVHEKANKPITMHMLSAAADLELLEFYELVSENIHKSPRALIRSMRLDTVAEQLQSTNKSVVEIARDCDFISPNYMIATFYHKFKKTPTQYREELDR